jgi:hypothetical protein
VFGQARVENLDFSRNPLVRIVGPRFARGQIWKIATKVAWHLPSAGQVEGALR